MSTRPVVAIIGAGGMGQAIARRIASGRKLLLADFSEETLNSAAESLRRSGYYVETHRVDISKHDQVVALAETVGKAGHVEAVVHTAGVSPAQAEARRILDVDLLGTANFLDAFHAIAHPGLSVVCIASMASHLRASTLSPELEKHLASAPLDKLLDHPDVEAVLQHRDLDMGTHVDAYSLSKRANILRVQAAAKAWGLKGARVNTVSPGCILTPMLYQETGSRQDGWMNQMLEASAMARIGTPEDVANVVVFLLSRESSYISGNDILVDGGVVSGARWSNAGGE